MSASKPLDRRINTVVYASLGCVIVTMLLMIPMLLVGLPKIIEGTDAASLQIRSDEVEACHAQYESRIRLAEVDLEIAQAQHGQVVREAIGAVILRDRDLLDRLGAEAVTVDNAMDDAISAVDAATKEQARALRLADKSISAFLDTCRR